MKKLLIALSLLLSFPAVAANIDIPGLPAAGSVAGTDLNECSQGGTSRKCTAAQMAAYVYGLTSGDATVNGTGAITFATVNGNVGSFGSTTNCTTITVNAKGLITAASQATCAPAIGSVTGLGTGVASAAGAALNASTGLVGALTATNNNCVVGNGSAWTSAACPGGTSTAIPSTQTGTNYPIVDGDRTKVIYLSNAANQIPTLPSAATLTTSNGWYVTACNIAVGTQTITPTTSTIAGAATYVLPAGSVTAPKCIGIVSDGTNYSIVPDYFRFGANVETAAGLALSAAGGLTTTVASGTSALGTSAIGSAACATAVTTTATNTATTDVVLWGFNGDPTAVTGYVPLVAGMLTIIAYPSANNVNFKVCNNTNASVTPGAITLNWSVRR